MNLLCPNCQKMITVLDQNAGQPVQCPLCQSTFTAPALPGAALAVPPSVEVSPGANAAHAAATAPTTVHAASEGYSVLPPPHTPAYPNQSPPVYAPPPRADRPTGPAVTPLSFGPEPEKPAPPPVQPGYGRVSSLWLTPRGLRWVTPVCLVLLFLFLFCSWLGVPGDPQIYQSGWGTGFGARSTALGLMFVLMYLFAFIVSVAAVVLTVRPMHLPGAVHQVWPWRSGIVAGFLLLAFLFLLLELLMGFGLEQYAYDAGRLVNIAKTDFLTASIELPYGSLLHRTFWLWLVVVLVLAGLTASALELWLAIRRTKPAPRLDFYR